MQKEKKYTVLILGAGASFPYGFPTGRGLVKAIRREFKGQYKAWTDSQIGGLDDFISALVRSDLDSIDIFLEQRREFEDIGKKAIATILLPREKEYAFWNDDLGEKNQKWYGYFWNRIRTPKAENFPKNSFAIITYNYDRSIEHYLFTAIGETYKGENTKEILGRIPVVHIHGQLGFLPWQTENNDDVPYILRRKGEPPKIFKEAIDRAASGIKIIYDDTIDQSEELKEAHKVLRQAKLVLFMGFGYDETNISRLNLYNVLPPDTPIHGTLYDIKGAEKKQIENIFSKLMNNNFPKWIPGSGSCIGCLRGQPFVWL